MITMILVKGMGTRMIMLIHSVFVTIRKMLNPLTIDDVIN